MARDKSAIIKIVQDLWRKADDAATPEGERASLIAKANELMARYQIDELVLNEAKPAGQQEAITALYVRVTEDGKVPIVKDQRVILCCTIARWNRCRPIVTSREATVDENTGKPIAGGTFVMLIGFKSDCDWTRDFFFAICYDMMEAMFNEPQNKKNYREQFCAGFVDRIDQRLRALQVEVKKAAEDVGMGLVLVKRDDLVRAEVQRQFPNLGTYRVRRGQFDPTARKRGADAANKSDLGQGKVSGSSSRGELR